jgi:flavin reductase (DIM6/NTAB) family NADH-FMN oxidoreductase RutF
MPPVLPVDAAAFRRAAGQFPSGIVVVCTRLDANPHAMTVSAFASVSLQPLLVMFCAEKIARFHDTVLAAGAWSVSVLDEDSEKTARWLATRGRPLAGQLDTISHHPGPVTGMPILGSALAALECRTTAVHDGGDHSIVVGEVVGVTEPRAGEPLIHQAGRYRRLIPDQ